MREPKEGPEGQGLVTIPAAAFERLVKVAEYVSMGRSYVGVRPYPDATARAALGSLAEREQGGGDA